MADFGELKQRHRAMWASGEYDAVAAGIRPVADHVVRAAGIRAGERVLDLRRREWAVLDALATRAGQIVLREVLQSEVFGFDEPVGPNAIEVNVARLRSKLSPDGPTVRTIRGVGYMLDAG